MSMLTMNCVTNWIRGSSSGQDFESEFAGFRDSVACIVSSFAPEGELKRVFVQYQYDCRGLPKAVSGIRVGRFSKKDGHIELYLEVTRAAFSPGEAGLALLRSLLLEGLSHVRDRLQGKVSNNVGALVAVLREASAGSRDSDDRGSRR